MAEKFAIRLGANEANKEMQNCRTPDMFAGAFLYGITHGHSYAEAGKIASLASSRVVSQFGPRLEPEQAKRVLKDLIY